MALTAFTDYSTIRSILGVSEEEIEDAELALNLRFVELVESLMDVSETLPDDFIAVSAVVSPSAEQTRFINLTKAYSGYAVASRLVSALPMFAPQQIKDNAAEQSRVSDPYANLRTEVIGSMEYLKLRLQKIYTQLYAAASVAQTVTRVRVSSTGLSVDPVTNA